jgi:hypothetical protein
MSNTAKSSDSFRRRILGGFGLNFLFVIANKLSVSLLLIGSAAKTLFGVRTFHNGTEVTVPINFLLEICPLCSPSLGERKGDTVKHTIVNQTMNSMTSYKTSDAFQYIIMWINELYHIILLFLFYFTR